MYQRLSLPNEITTGESRGTKLSSAQALVLFRNVVIRGGTSVTYFLNAHCIYLVECFLECQKCMLVSLDLVKSKYIKMH